MRDITKPPEDFGYVRSRERPPRETALLNHIRKTINEDASGNHTAERRGFLLVTFPYETVPVRGHALAKDALWLGDCSFDIYAVELRMAEPDAPVQPEAKPSDAPA